MGGHLARSVESLSEKPEVGRAYRKDEEQAELPLEVGLTLEECKPGADQDQEQDLTNDPQLLRLGPEPRAHSEAGEGYEEERDATDDHVERASLLATYLKATDRIHEEHHADELNQIVDLIAEHVITLNL